MTPYLLGHSAGEVVYQERGITLIHGDSREVLPALAPVGAICTDPPWPGVPGHISGSDDAWGLFAAVALAFPRLADRVIVHLGGQSDPRILAAVPPALPYLRTAWLRWGVPRHRGTILDTADVAYIFGAPTLSKPGTHVMPGEVTGTSTVAGRRERNPHPCPRKLEHVQWLLAWYTPPGAVILDPFVGSGTTPLACRLLDRPCVGVEKERRWLDLTIERLERQPLLDFGAVAS